MSINTDGANYQNGNSFTYTNSYGQVTKITNITREFDEEGRLVKETETVTEYSKPFIQPAPYQPYPYTISSGGIAKGDGETFKTN